jgi:hypothetical protein
LILKKSGAVSRKPRQYLSRRIRGGLFTPILHFVEDTVGISSLREVAHEFGIAVQMA